MWEREMSNKANLPTAKMHHRGTETTEMNVNQLGKRG